MADILKVDGLGDQPEQAPKLPQAEEKSSHLGWWIGLGILAAILLILNSPIFSLRHFEVEGNERVTDEAIMEDLGLSYGTNLFRYALSHLHADPDVDPRLTTVDVYFQWPSTVKVVVEEGETIGYVYFQGTYLCIDRKGQVASSTSQPDEDLPVITGLDVGSFTVGQQLTTNDQEKYAAVMTIGSNVRKYGLEAVVEQINVRSLDNIVLTTKKWTVNCGDLTDIGKKIAILAELNKNPDVPSGVIHMEDLSSQVYLVSDSGTSTVIVQEDSSS